MTIQAADTMTIIKPAHNSTYKKLAVQYSADSFEVAESLVLRINICGENRQLLVAAKRYGQVKKTKRFNMAHKLCI